jgi:hypothetical protein
MGHHSSWDLSAFPRTSDRRRAVQAGENVARALDPPVERAGRVFSLPA